VGVPEHGRGVAGEPGAPSGSLIGEAPESESKGTCVGKIYDKADAFHDGDASAPSGSLIDQAPESESEGFGVCKPSDQFGKDGDDGASSSESTSCGCQGPDCDCCAGKPSDAEDSADSDTAVASQRNQVPAASLAPHSAGRTAGKTAAQHGAFVPEISPAR